MIYEMIMDKSQHCYSRLSNGCTYKRTYKTENLYLAPPNLIMSQVNTL